MSDHLPECPCANTSAHPDGCLCCEVSSPCICDRLRACEQRIENQFHFYTGPDVYAGGYAAGLDAAREAVERAYEKDSPTVQHGTIPGVALALAAIDALRGTRGDD